MKCAVTERASSLALSPSLPVRPLPSIPSLHHFPCVGLNQRPLKALQTTPRQNCRWLSPRCLWHSLKCMSVLSWTPHTSLQSFLGERVAGTSMNVHAGVPHCHFLPSSTPRTSTQKPCVTPGLRLWVQAWAALSRASGRAVPSECPKPELCNPSCVKDW